MHELRAILQRLNEPSAFPAVLATLVRATGSSYRRVGARLLIEASGHRLGSISGGCLETDLVARALQLIENDTPGEVVVYDTTTENDLVWGVGLGCQGIVHVVLELYREPPGWASELHRQTSARRTCQVAVGFELGSEFGTHIPLWDEAPQLENVFFQSINPRTRLVVAGAGEDARPLVSLAHRLGWEVIILDPRKEMVTRERFPSADAVLCGPAETAGSLLAWDDWTAAVIMTHHYRFDRPLLGALLPLGLPYLGLLGPRARAERLLRELTPAPRAEDVARLHAPVGLDLGGDGPEAVALAIVAEIQAVFHRRDGRPLRDRQGSIHD